MQSTSYLYDNRTDCYSVIVELNIGSYLELIELVYKDKGGLSEQREPLKSSSALRIRKQMVKDILIGTVLPPIVLGLIIPTKEFEGLPFDNSEKMGELLTTEIASSLSIIDGMQRTTALFEAAKKGADLSKKLRLEFWIAKELNSLIYRMLVLNTGQVPWNIRRQIETVFKSMIIEINKAIPQIEIYTINDSSRRSQPAQYHGKDVIELYMAFGSRKEKVDTKERLADEFTKLDFIDATESKDFSKTFYKVLERLAKLDRTVSRYSGNTDSVKFRNGIDLFKSQPARVGFTTAIAKKIYGRPGKEKSHEQINKDQEKTFKQLDNAIKQIESQEVNRLAEFLSFPVLNEKLNIKTTKVGDYEREFFTKAFETMIEEGGNLDSLAICWLAY